MVLLDTHVWIWAHSQTHLLSQNAKALIQRTAPGERAIASISMWEFAMMVTKGRITVKIDPKRWLHNATTKSGLRIMELTPEIAMEACNLPGDFHKDPADRIIVATARTHKLTLLTKDSKIRVYPNVKAIW
ncbi:MAG: type II toxin-antitoxin system VapC family toxin [Deltaproteobacteria bacterium]|nr:type II toxin-antitoxin system VapC family toxin [Deltaproteobacteria bacterium]